jgi:hypothetical protein
MTLALPPARFDRGRFEKIMYSMSFDYITYTKGGAVLSMLEGWIGPEAFQRGLAAIHQGAQILECNGN